jgi:predicted methyltransferase
LVSLVAEDRSTLDADFGSWCAIFKMVVRCHITWTRSGNISFDREQHVRRGISMRVISFRLVRVALGASLLQCLMACTLKPVDTVPPPLSPQRVAKIVASPDRSAADRTNDLRRKPEPMLVFIGVRPGIIALDVSAGGGYTSELLARAIGPTGTVYGQSQPRDPSRAPPAPAAPEGASHPATASEAAPVPARTPSPRTSAVALAERDQNLRSANVAAARIVPVSQRFDDPVPAALAIEGLDLVTLMFNYHDLGFLGVDRDKMNLAIFRALKPGGVYVIADHAGRPGTGISESGSLHRIEEAFLRSEVEAAGFRLSGEANFLRNPTDPRDQNTPNPPQPKDEFVLKFVKP